MIAGCSCLPKVHRSRISMSVMPARLVGSLQQGTSQLVDLTCAHFMLQIPLWRCIDSLGQRWIIAQSQQRLRLWPKRQTPECHQFIGFFDLKD